MLGKGKELVSQINKVIENRLTIAIEIQMKA
jgi:hypothetical protein